MGKPVLDAFYEMGCTAGGFGEAGHATPDDAPAPICVAAAGRCDPQSASETADFCVFDCETSGLSRHDCALQVALGLFDREGVAIEIYDRLWKLPQGVQVSVGSHRIHGISQGVLDRHGVDAAPELLRVLAIFRTMRARRRRIVAHNASFDCRILRQTAAGHGIRGWDIGSDDVFCTMRRATPWCGIVSRSTGRAKAPSNDELFRILTGTAPQGALHDAAVDIEVTARSFVEGKKRGWWQ